jgi:hypothetical protein
MCCGGGDVGSSCLSAGMAAGCSSHPSPPANDDNLLVSIETTRHLPSSPAPFPTFSCPCLVSASCPLALRISAVSSRSLRTYYPVSSAPHSCCRPHGPHQRLFFVSPGTPRTACLSPQSSHKVRIVRAPPCCWLHGTREIRLARVYVADITLQ